MTIIPALVLVVVAAGSVLALWQPLIGVLVYLWLDFMRPHDWFPELCAYRPMLVIAVATLVAAVWRHRRHLLDRWRSLLPLVVLTVVVLLTTVLSRQPMQSAAAAVLVGKMLLLVWLLSTVISTEGRFEAVIWVVSVALAVLAVSAILQGIDRGLVHEFRPALAVEGPPGPFWDNNNLARVLALSVPLWWMLVSLPSAAWRRMVAMGGFLLAVAAIVFTFSRGGFLALMTAIVGLSLSYGLRGTLLIPPLFAAALVLLSPRPYVDRILTISRPSQEASVQSRVEVWKEAVKTAKAHPLNGIGPGLFRGSEAGRTSHNIFFELLAETGVMGLAAYSWVLAATFGRLYQLRRGAAETEGAAYFRTASFGLQAALLGYLVASSALSGPFQSPLFVLVGLTLALARQADGQLRTAGAAPRAARSWLVTTSRRG